MGRRADGGRARVKFEALKRIAGAEISEHRRFLLMNCVETYLPLKGREAEEYASLVGAPKSPEIRAMQITWADKEIAKMEVMVTAKLKAEMAAKLEAEIAAKMEAQSADRFRGTVIRLLCQRFGKVPARLAKRLAAIGTVDELGAIADRIFEVQSLDELGLGGSATR